MTDLHTHTSFCDGTASPEEMAEAALRLGLDCLGFSGHSYTFFEESYCMSPAGTEEYIRRVENFLKTVHNMENPPVPYPANFWAR